MIPRYTRREMGAVWNPQSKYRRWLEVELLACEAFAQLGVIPQEAVADLRARQPEKFDEERIDAIEAEVHHDVIAFTTWLGEVMGPNARFIHYGLTSYDVVDTALSLGLREALDLILAGLEEVRQVLAHNAYKYKNTLLAGRTHGVHAEPISFGFKMALWHDEARRNQKRLQQARQAISVGRLSGAVGTFATVDPRVEEYVCRALDLQPAGVSTQVLQRDRHAQLMSALAILAGSLETIAVEIRHLQKTETREAEEPFRSGQKGSSAMPHKRNPVICERISGLARVVRGNTLAALENQALWHERDISHSSVERIILPDTTILIDYMLHLTKVVLSDLRVYPAAMAANLELTGGLIYSQGLMLALVDKGLNREEAYAAVQSLAMQAWEGQGNFPALVKADPVISARLSDAEIDACFDPARSLQHMDHIYRQAGL